MLLTKQFRTRFEDTFDPFRGDVIYGLTGPRDTYLNRWIEKKKRAHDPADDGPLDHYERDLQKYTETAFINYFNAPILAVDPLKHEPRLNDKFPAIETYIRKLQATRYKTSSVRGKQAIPGLAKGNAEISDEGFATTDDPKVIQAAQVLAIRRACKFGIEYVTQIKSGIVHYVLDAINMRSVIDKSTEKLWAGTTGVPITTSELRYLFRNWYRLKSLASDGKIIFWTNDYEVPAPWEANPKDWLDYAKRRLEKKQQQLLEGKPEMGKHITNFTQSFASNPEAAMQSFFEIPTGEDLLGR